VRHDDRGERSADQTGHDWSGQDSTMTAWVDEALKPG
jgi:hypothetical protein